MIGAGVLSGPGPAAGSLEGVSEPSPRPSATSPGGGSDGGSSGDPGSVEPEPVRVRVRRLGVRTRDPFGTGTDSGRGGANYRRRGKEEEGGLNPDRVSRSRGAEDLGEMGAGGGGTPLRGAAGRDGVGGKEATEPADAESDGSEPPAGGEVGIWMGGRCWVGKQNSEQR